MKQKVVIIGHGYLSRLALIRSLGQAGYDVTVIVTMYGEVNTTQPLDCYSKYVSDVYYCNARDNDGLIKILMERCTCVDQKVVIIPDSDWSASIVDNNRNILKEHFLFPQIYDKDVYVTNLMDKERQKKLAREIGLTVPNTTSLKVVDGIIPDLSQVLYPCFTKALTTMGGGKQWFKRCNNETELRKALTSFAKGGNAEILVEDFIEIEKEYAVVGVTNGKNVIIPGIIRFVENCQCHLGIARKGEILPVKGYEQLLEQFKQYVKKTNFVGLFDIDFLYSKGKYYFCEMNFRYGGSGYAYTKSGINLPAMFVQMTNGQLDISTVKETITEKRIYINERMLLDDLRAKNLTIREFNNAINTTDISFVKDEEDPKPQRRYNRLVTEVKVKYLLKKILRR